MAGQVVKPLYFGQSATDRLVMKWMEAEGIKPTEVMGYTITRNAQAVSTITLTMRFTEQE